MRKKQLFNTVTASTNSAGEPEMMISTSTPDRDNDRVMPQGAQIDDFMKNPVLLWAHNYYEIPIGTVTRLNVSEQGIRQSWRWLENDPQAERVRNAWDQGVVRAASIGFNPIDYERNDLGGFDITRWTLLEVSLVPVPANQEAVRAMKSLGIEPYERNQSSSLAFRELLARFSHNEHLRGG